MPATYINPLTDFGFKKLFGEEPNKELLISFLNTLLPDHHQIADLQYTKNEYQGVSPVDRRAIFDLNCMSTSGERFIIELQKVKQRYFKDRSLYYATFAIQEQAKQGEWDYKLSTVYTIGILDFLMEDAAQKVLYYAQLKDQDNQPFFDKLHFIYVVLPRFTKTLEQLDSLQDKWLYTFRHLAELTDVPDQFTEAVFRRLFAIAELAHFDPQDRQRYEESLKYLRDLKNSEVTAREEGRMEGIQIGREEGREEGAYAKAESIARQLLQLGALSDEEIAQVAGLPLAVIQQLAMLK
jgi:predicted transposase/invertase (TIGR01784 family)